MNNKILRHIVETIESAGKPVSVYTDGHSVWCDGYPFGKEFDVELLGVYSAMADNYDRDEMKQWILDDFAATQ